MAFAFLLNFMLVAYVISHNDEYVTLNQTDVSPTTFLNDIDTTFENLFDNYTDKEYTTENSFSYQLETHFDESAVEEYTTEYFSNSFETFFDDYTIEQEFTGTEIPEEYSSFFTFENTDMDSSNQFIYETTQISTPSSNDSIYFLTSIIDLFETTDLNSNDTLPNMTTTIASLSTQNEYAELTSSSEHVIDDLKLNSNSPLLTTSK